MVLAAARGEALMLAPLVSLKATPVKVERNCPPRKLMAVAPAGRALKVMLVMDKLVNTPPAPWVAMSRP